MAQNIFRDVTDSREYVENIVKRVTTLVDGLFGVNICQHHTSWTDGWYDQLQGIPDNLKGENKENFGEKDQCQIKSDISFGVSEKSNPSGDEKCMIVEESDILVTSDNMDIICEVEVSDGNKVTENKPRYGTFCSATTQSSMRKPHENKRKFIESCSEGQKNIIKHEDTENGTKAPCTLKSLTRKKKSNKGKKKNPSKLKRQSFRQFVRPFRMKSQTSLNMIKMLQKKQMQMKVDGLYKFVLWHEALKAERERLLKKMELTKGLRHKISKMTRMCYSKHKAGD